MIQFCLVLKKLLEKKLLENWMNTKKLIAIALNKSKGIRVIRGEIKKTPIILPINK